MRKIEGYSSESTLNNQPGQLFELNDERRVLPFGVTLEGADETIALESLKNFCESKCGPNRDQQNSPNQCAREVLLDETVQSPRASSELACIACALSRSTGGPMFIHRTRA